MQQDDTKDQKTTTAEAMEEVIEKEPMNLDEEAIDDHIVEMLGGKKGIKKTAEKSDSDEHEIIHDEDDVVSEEEIENPQSLIKKLRADLKTAQQEKMDVMTSWQRDKADFLNARKRDQETQADVIRFANQNLIIDMLPTLDGYEQATQQPSWTSVDETWRKGIESLMLKIYASLQKVGVEKYGKVGDVFDPNLHQAVGNVETTEKEKDQTLALVMQTGYKLHDKVVRPALVQIFQI
jgi:molecular chaperone GrpE